jgi:hypothetical protein
MACPDVMDCQSSHMSASLEPLATLGTCATLNMGLCQRADSLPSPDFYQQDGRLA